MATATDPKLGYGHISIDWNRFHPSWRYYSFGFGWGNYHAHSLAARSLVFIVVYVRVPSVSLFVLVVYYVLGGVCEVSHAYVLSYTHTGRRILHAL